MKKLTLATLLGASVFSSCNDHDPVYDLLSRLSPQKDKGEVSVLTGYDAYDSIPGPTARPLPQPTVNQLITELQQATGQRDKVRIASLQKVMRIAGACEQYKVPLTICRMGRDEPLASQMGGVYNIFPTHIFYTGRESPSKDEVEKVEANYRHRWMEGRGREQEIVSYWVGDNLVKIIEGGDLR
ncbi:hypothetical protein HYS50_00310 [Candidatus Woesearchaeota archaeon]|nr:hypothetical protein [Candidatus Woesearchaeota archaeon]